MDTTMNAKPHPSIGVVPDAAYATEARAKLASHLDRIDDAVSTASDLDSQFKRLHSIADAERQALAKLEQIRADRAKDLADAVRDGRGLPGNSADELSDAEHAVRIAQRAADAARRVLPTIEPRLNAARAEVNRLNALTPPLVAHVMLDENARLVAELMAETERMRKKAAVIWGLRKLLADFQQKEMRGFFSKLPDPHCEWPTPTNQSASDECDRWSALYGALLKDQTTKIDDIKE
jgi:hypothetical protein